ncbi:MAG: N-acetylglucosamine-6-phosphate deacetylase [Calditrichales bacterium]|nr:MAG: N-acetylglucosamine-6-phosphate deacetylase [Calditrichales bacterium]
MSQNNMYICAVTILMIWMFTMNYAIASDSENRKVEGVFYLDGSQVTVEIVDGKIDRIIRNEKSTTAGDKKVFIAPGFIDNQVNGYLSHSFVRDGLTVDQVRLITKAFWSKGITTYVPTLTTGSAAQLRTNFKIMHEAIQDPEIALSVPGFHLEGPYISPVEGYRGAHNEEWVRPPDWQEFMDLYRASGNHIIEVTVAPEMEGALSFIEKLRKMDIVVALGHHNGSAEQIQAAIDAGASIATHLGNGCANSIHRHNNPLWPQLADDRLTASLIVDGFHLTRDEVQVFYKVKGPDRTILISDLSSLAGMPPGEYERFGSTVVVHPNGMISLPSQNVLAAASFLITSGVENVMRFTGCTLGDAVHMASRNTARLLNLRDRGEIRVGMRADLVLFTLQDGHINIRNTFVAGKEVYRAAD